MPRITDVTVDSGWAIEESMIDGSQLWVQETRFTLGNGYIGSRGILEEGHSNGYPGSYIAGIYDRVAGEPSEIVNLPNPVGVQVSVDGLTLSAEDMKVLDHRRVLDLRNAVLSRRTVFAAAGKRYEYESIRFFSLSNPHIGVMTFSLCSLDADAEITVTQAIDGTTRNEVQAVGQPVKHYTVSASEAGNGRSYLEATTNDPVVQVGMATVCMPRGARPGEGAAAAGDAGGQSAVQRVRFTARRGRRYRFDLFISTWTSRELGGPPRAACLSTLKTAIRSGASELVRRHRRAWERRWAVSDIRIDGDRELQKAMRFNIYHLLIAAAPQDLDASVAAKALTGEWYKGHVFWDNEIYVLPFFTFTQPAVARNLLLYRSRRLPQARDKARAQGYAGSLWPWESAEDGRDETPDTWVNFDGTKIPVYNKTREHHIAADVAYGIISYWRATGDDDFLLRHGAEMVLETARFWASRATYNKQTCHYEIREVIGPNEFQESVDNNSYTNSLASWVLRTGVWLFHRLRADHPRLLKALAERMVLNQQEVEGWTGVANEMVLLKAPNGLIEEFQGYFDRRDVRIEEWDGNGAPVWPASVELSEAADTQLVKQADVILLLHLLSDDVTLEEKRVNYEYYLPRTTHKSSLSPPAYAITALQLGRTEAAYDLLAMCANTDYKDVYGNTGGGVHSASLGGAWQVVVNGFGGVRVLGDTLNIDPVLPSRWRGLTFRLWFRRLLLDIRVTNSSAEVTAMSGRGEVKIRVLGQDSTIRKGQTVHVPRQ